MFCWLNWTLTEISDNENQQRVQLQPFLSVKVNLINVSRQGL